MKRSRIYLLVLVALTLSLLVSLVPGCSQPAPTAVPAKPTATSPAAPAPTAAPKPTAAPAATATAVPKPTAAPATIKFKLATTMPIGTDVTKAGDMFKQLIEERSKGRIQVAHYPAGQLYNTQDVAEAVPSGAVEIAFCQSAIASVVPEYDLFNTELLLRSAKETFTARDQVGPLLQPIFNKKFNAQLLGWVNYGTDLAWAFNKPITKMSDFAGLKARSPGGGHSIALKTVGVAPVDMSPADVYLALQRGTIDGVASGYESVQSRKWYEVIKYVSGWYSGSFLYAVTANLDFWKKLSADDQKLISQATLDTQTWSDKNAEVRNAEIQQKLKDLGMNFMNVPDAEYAIWTDLASKALVAYFTDRFGKASADQLIPAVEKAIGRPLYQR